MNFKVDTWTRRLPNFITFGLKACWICEHVTSMSLAWQWAFRSRWLCPLYFLARWGMPTFGTRVCAAGCTYEVLQAAICAVSVCHIVSHVIDFDGHWILTLQYDIGVHLHPYCKPFILSVEVLAEVLCDYDRAQVLPRGN